MKERSLRNVPLFEGLDDKELETISEVTASRRFTRDTVIILAEEEGESLFIIEQGQVKVTIVGHDGREVILSLLGPGSVFGELALLDGKPRSANVIATEDTLLVTLRRTDFLQILLKMPQIATTLLAELASRLRKTDRQIEGLALLDVHTRILETLLQLAAEIGVDTDDGVIINNRPTHQELANMSGTTRETVSRMLKRLEREGYITVVGRTITIATEEL